MEKVVALELGNPNNSKGQDVAASINSSLNILTNLQDNLNRLFFSTEEYDKGFVWEGGIPLLLKDFTDSEKARFPVEIPKEGVTFAGEEVIGKSSSYQYNASDCMYDVTFTISPEDFDDNQIDGVLFSTSSISARANAGTKGLTCWVGKNINKNNQLYIRFSMTNGSLTIYIEDKYHGKPMRVVVGTSGGWPIIWINDRFVVLDSDPNLIEYEGSHTVYGYADGFWVGNISNTSGVFSKPFHGKIHQVKVYPKRLTNSDYTDPDANTNRDFWDYLEGSHSYTEDFAFIFDTNNTTSLIRIKDTEQIRGDVSGVYKDVLDLSGNIIDKIRID
ncbi:hypothetical protein [Pseudoalteromonas phage J2-1_QLiu-2017]|nr:hypothetical protein [Pseudoalteromonas phage J2-1_QLiu-2017]